MKPMSEQRATFENQLFDLLLKQENIATPDLSIKARTGNGEAPVSYAQQRYWLLHQADPKGYTYNIFDFIKFDERLDLSRVKKAMELFVAHHGILRTTFKLRGHQLIQVISPESKFVLSSTEIGDIKDENALVHEIIAKEREHPFDLENGPLIRLCVILSGTISYVSFVTHHILNDGISNGLILAKLAKYYDSLRQENARIQPPDIQYADYAIWEKEQLAGEKLAELLAYWDRQLKNKPPLTDIPTDHLRRDDLPVEGEILNFPLSGNLVEQLNRDAQQLEITPFVILLTILKIVIRNWTESGDICLGTVVSNRVTKQLEQTIGCFVNYLPLRTVINGADSIAETLRKVGQTVADALDHRTCPFDEIVKYVSRGRIGAINPIYNIGFLLQNYEKDLPAGLLENEKELGSGHAASGLDIRIVVEMDEKRGKISWEYQTNLFKRDTILLLHDEFLKISKAVLQNKVLKVEELRITQPLIDQRKAGYRLQNRPKLTLLSSFNSAPLRNAVTKWKNSLQLDLDIDLKESAKTPSDLFGTTKSKLSSVYFLRIRDWIPSETSPDENVPVEKFTSEFVECIVANLVKNGPCLIVLCPEDGPGDPQLHNLTLVKARLIAALEHLQDVEVTEASDRTGGPGIESQYYDRVSDELAQIPYTDSYFDLLAKSVIRKWIRAHAQDEHPYKVLVLDCDGTLWKGICGEIGAGELEINQEHLRLQRFARKVMQEGILLALCSHNNERDVTKVFESRKDMILSLDDFVSKKISWAPKSVSIREIAGELNVGLDSFVFIDDNPVICAEVEAGLPQVLTICIPQEGDDESVFTDSLWMFDKSTRTAEDTVRTQLYREEAVRASLKGSLKSLPAFYESLGVKVKFIKAGEGHCDRISQLMLRVTQFNFNQMPDSTADVKRWLSSADQRLVAVQVEDRFGDYGLCGCFLFRIDPLIAEVPLFLLSCRALERGVEHQMMVEIGKMMQQAKVDKVRIPFRATERNIPARNFLSGLGWPASLNADGTAVFELMATQMIAIKFDPNAHSVNKAEKHPDEWIADFKSRLLNRRNALYKSIIKYDKNKKGHHAPRAVVYSDNARKRDFAAGISEIWNSILEKKSGPFEDNFFLAGGDSLKAIRLIAAIQQRLGFKIPLGDFLQRPTINNINQIISDLRNSLGKAAGPSANPVNDDHVVVMAPGPPKISGTPLFIIPGVGGDVVIFRNLSKMLGRKRSIYALQPQGINDLEVPREDLEQIVQDHLDLILKVQSAGPYFLLGWCSGGIIAYETAIRLKGLGREVNHVFLVESALPDDRLSPKTRDGGSRIKQKIALQLSKLRQEGLFYPINRARNVVRAFRKERAVSKYKKNLRRKIPLSHEARLELLSYGQSKGFRHYRGKHYEGNVSVIWSEQDPDWDWLSKHSAVRFFNPEDAMLAWRKFVSGKVNYHQICGDHLSIYEHPNVAQMSDYIEKKISGL